MLCSGTAKPSGISNQCPLSSFFGLKLIEILFQWKFVWFVIGIPYLTAYPAWILNYNLLLNGLGVIFNVNV